LPYRAADHSLTEPVLTLRQCTLVPDWADVFVITLLADIYRRVFSIGGYKMSVN